MSEYQTILFEVDDNIATITLNRPDRLNAIVDEMHDDFRAVLEIVERDPEIRCLMFTGAGRGFCAGADLTRRDPGANTNLDAGASLENNYNPLMLRLAALPKPIVGAVNGPCAGAGMSIALACDIIIAARSASFLQAFARIGLVPDAGSTWQLPRQIGRARALGMALLGEQISAETAGEWGLVWDVVEDDELIPRAREIAGRLAQGPTRGLGLIRRALHESADNSLAEQLDLERDLQREAASTEDFAEGVGAFLEKRRPAFRGR